MKRITKALMLLTMIASAVFLAKPNVAMADTKGLDSELDNPVKGMMSEDDFPDPKDWEAYINENPGEGIALFGLWYPDTHMHVGVEKKYTVTNLPVNRVFQQFYIDNDPADPAMYFTQRQRDADGGVNTTVLSKCSFDSTTGTVNGIINGKKDYMTLHSFGHGQTLEGYEYNGEKYFWISCKANTAYDNAWALQIGRIKYESGKTINSYTEISRFADLAYANKTGTYFGDVKRVDAALSTDGTMLLFWVQDVNNNIQYSIYRTDVLNAYLDVTDLVGSKYISFKDNNVLRAACISSFTQTAAEAVLPNGSNQGIELDNDGNIYITGGNIGEIPEIAVMDGKTGSYTYSNLMTLNHADFGAQTETEGIKLAHDGIYIGTEDHAKDTKQLYFLPYESIGQGAVHDDPETRNAKEATCTEAGYTGDIYCKGCNELLRQGETIPALGHAWDGGVVTKQPLAAVTGTSRFTCTRGCGAVEDRTIPATGIAPSKGTVLVINNIKYKITKAGLKNGTVQVTGVVKSKSSITIPKTIVDQGITYKVTSIGAKAFLKDKTMTKISIGSNVTTIYENAFYKAAKLKTVSGASGVVNIGKQAFYNCTKLTTVTFGSKLNKIYTKAFYKCTSLSKITIKSTKLTSSKIGSKAFTSIKSGAKVDVPKSKIKSYRTLFRNKGLNKKAKVY